MNNLTEPGRCVPPPQSYPKHPLIPVGTKIGLLVVIENGLYLGRGKNRNRACRVRCQCGVEALRYCNGLRRDGNQSCGCNNAETYRKLAAKTPLIPAGTRFGWRVVIETGLRVKDGPRMVRACRVRCQCGDEAIRSVWALRNGHSDSCGCKMRGTNTASCWRAFYRSFKGRGWDFHLTLPQLKAIVGLPCAYCGKEPSNIFRRGYKVGGVLRRDVYPELIIRWSGLDRVDSSKGYIHGNIVPCCFECNGMKTNHTLEEFLDLVGRIRAYDPSAASVRELAARL
jgi:hypothetical protein